MRICLVFKRNSTQEVQLPVDMCFADHVKTVLVRKRGKERVLTPVEHAWDSFFLADKDVSDDFLSERASQEQAEKEAF